ncbi:MAG: phosphoribosylamine--glycine ligase [Bacteroidota bacterium]
MNVLILGSGGREHTFAWKLKQSKHINDLFVAPGNAGTESIATNLDVDILDFNAVKSTIVSHNINMVVVGPEAPLVAGIHDFFLSDETLKNVPVIGPQKEAATLEGSKAFAKEFMQRHAIPTAKYRAFTQETLEEGKRFLEKMKAPYVLKADGLAAGKGVLILKGLGEAQKQLEAMLLHSKFGKASATVVIEEFLDGIELSCFVITDGEHYKILPFAKDYKRIGEGDTGLNTGGMGAVSPVPFVDEVFEHKIEEQIVRPTVAGLKKDGIPYQGFIFIGLIKVGDQPKVIEYNVRMGDPETEVVLPRIKNDLLEIVQAVAAKQLNTITLEIDSRTAATVMLVSGGYPEAYEKGMEIQGLENVENELLFHAGTLRKEGKVVTNGGRVIAVSSLGGTQRKALTEANKNAERIHFTGKYFRKDIGFDL